MNKKGIAPALRMFMVNGEETHWTSNHTQEYSIANRDKVNEVKLRVSKSSNRPWDTEEGIIFLLRLEGWVSISQWETEQEDKVF